MRKVLVACLLLLLSLGAASAGEFGEITKDYTPHFPQDFYYRDGYRLQWWYFTGHLFTPEGREFGYELTFFVAGVQRKEFRSRFGVRNIYISHFAISDAKDSRYSFYDNSDSGAYGFAGADGKKLHVWVRNDEMEGTISRMHLAAAGGDTSLDLTLVPVKPVILNGDKGYSRKSEESPDIASWYFSYPDMKTGGRLSFGGRTFPVTGRSWFDREISSGTMGKNEKGWDWFSVQLDDGRDLMLYLMRKKDGTADRYSSGTFVYPDGRYRHLTLGDFTVTVLGHYTSKKTGARYPSGWRVQIPSEDLTLRIIPLIRDQEFVASSSTGNHYWEGDCEVRGSSVGRAYVELTGY
jgi:predicted secreted hydrolase